jgi:hypothetical protein
MPALNLAFQSLEQWGLNFQHSAATLAGEVNVVLTRARLIVVAVAFDVHKVEFVNSAQLFQRFQGAINRGEVQSRQLLPSPTQHLRRVEMFTRPLEDVGNHLPLTGYAETVRFELTGYGTALGEVLA